MDNHLTPDELDDFVTNTLKLFKRKRWVDISLQHQEYVSARLMDRRKVYERGGEQISWRVQVKNTGLARNTGMFDTDVTGVEDVMRQASVPWAKQTVNFSYDIDEAEFQSERETIIRILRVREHDAMNSLAELNETNLWGQPSTSSQKVPMGIPFWLKKENTIEPDGEFNGGNPTGFSAGAGGIDSVEFPRWQNYTFAYKTVSRDDLVKKIKKAIRYTHFMPPVSYPGLGGSGKKPDHEIFTTYRVLDPLETMAEDRNDNLGKDVARYLNEVTVGGIPITWVPWLTANDTTDPLYGVNWKSFNPFVKKGCENRRSAPIVSPSSHTVRTVHYDTWCNYVCYSRRDNFVGVLEA